MTYVNSTSFHVFDIYDFRQILRHINIPFVGKLALVVAQITKNHCGFETESVNVGQNVKFLSVLKKAYEWLQ